jgi:hypothetical protein
MANISQRFLNELKKTLSTGQRQYAIAGAARVHHSTLSQIRNEADPLHPGDDRVCRIVAVLGLNPDECFTDEAV